MKKILITGASDGIGLETARLLAQQGNQLMLVARNKAKLETAVAALPGKGHALLVADLSKKTDVHTVADHISAANYDVLINNAGVGMYGRFEELPLDQQAAMMHLNMYGLTILSHSFLKHAKQGDSLVNISSVLGSTSCPGSAVYAATKAYVTNFSESLWWENKERGVYVLGFCPGVTQTNFHEISGGRQDMFSKGITQTSAAVAEELVHVLKKRKKPKAISGGMNRMMVFFQRLMPRKAMINIMGASGPLEKL